MSDDNVIPEAGGEVGGSAVLAASEAFYVSMNADRSDWAVRAWADMGGSEPSDERAEIEIAMEAALAAALPHLTPQPDGDVRERGTKGPTEHLINAIGRVMLAEWERAEGEPLHVSYVATLTDGIRAVLASGFVVPVGEVERLRAENESLRASVAREHGEPLDDVYTTDGVDIVIENLREARKERGRAEAQVAAVRALVEAWESTQGVAMRHVCAEITAALTTAPASPTTDSQATRKSDLESSD